ncbi:zinc ribbon-containing protein [Halorubrum amylolyticum]|uniref:zinc ribbon-containing protein n=1 Tax=Halorubrum amylolyticum TaxID=2508724 RepID=UPI001008DAD9
MTYNVGEKPGKGVYRCINCSWEVTLDDADDTLPPCGSCGEGHNTVYRLVRRL